MAEQAAWDEVLDAYEAGRLSSRNSHTVLNRTPVVLARILSDDGKNPNLKIVIDRSILDKTTGKTPSKFTGEYHHISVKDLRGLLVNLDNPIAVFDSETIPGDKVVLTEIKDFETGENAVVALAIGTKRGYIAVNAKVADENGEPLAAGARQAMSIFLCQNSLFKIRHNAYCAI